MRTDRAVRIPRCLIRSVPKPVRIRRLLDRRRSDCDGLYQRVLHVRRQLHSGSLRSQANVDLLLR